MGDARGRDQARPRGHARDDRLHLPGDAYSHSNPIKAALAVPPEAWAQVLLFCGVMEWSLNGGKMTMLTMFEGKSRQPGDFGWDPMGLMSPANEERMKMRELQHGRLA